ncbi:MAG: glucose 1-dehydrogenase [Acidobacteria bacterium]|nr:glucose 1-dehydrogenase [Acidobacteriota bacterium]
MKQRFQDKVVIVTGASSGIGKVAARAFAREGACVVLAARRQEEGNQIAAEIKAAGGEAVFIQTDVARTQDVIKLVETTVATYGRLDCAFNNAGIGGDAMTLTADHSEENWDNVMSVNLKGVWLCMKYQIPEMLKHGGGSIVNNSSIYGLGASTVGHVPYAVSKHGVIGLTKTAAFEYAKQGIRVNAICPGFTHTELVDAAIEAIPALFEKLLTNDIPMGRIAEAEEIVNAVLWLCSEEASFVTGQALAPDGGWLAK